MKWRRVNLRLEAGGGEARGSQPFDLSASGLSSSSLLMHKGE
jgi:hypothetical protein